ncbi:Rhamnogalacturonate lyase A [Diplonema papillatum]|nr:Rhamnogalacturonate lyase A [Diplonema papillatum]
MMTNMRWALFAAAAACVSGFGLTSTADEYTIDTGAKLVFSVRRTAPPASATVGSIGGITSLKYDDVEYAQEGGYSTVNKGFDLLFAGVSDVTVDAVVVDTTMIKVTVVTPFLTQYYIAKDGDARIYMGTIWTKQPDVESKIHFVLRLNPDLVPTFSRGNEGDIRLATDPALEADDVFLMSNNETRSTYYTMSRAVDWTFAGVTGPKIGFWLIRGLHEAASGGPFHRAPMSLTTNDTQELIYAVNDIHAQTEAFRVGTLSTYTFAASPGFEPDTAVSYEFYAELNVTGFVPEAERCEFRVRLIENDYVTRHRAVFTSEQGQYWATMRQRDGYFRAPFLLPGVYTMTVYKEELALHVIENITAEAGTSVTLPDFSVLASDPSTQPAVFRIGDWDGSPRELRNGEMVLKMHPSDARLDSWATAPFIVDTNTTTDFPAYMFQDVNDFYTIEFALSEALKATTRTFRIGTTVGNKGARPSIQVNSAKKSSVPPKPFSIPTRTLTLGTYRSVNEMHTYDIAPSAWTTDAMQTITVRAESGSAGVDWLSPSIAFDCLDLLGEETMAPTSAPATSAPATPLPTTNAPLTTAPSTPSPPTSAPETTDPVTTVPVTSEPVTTSPSTDAASTTFNGILLAMLSAAAIVAML